MIYNALQGLVYKFSVKDWDKNKELLEYVNKKYEKFTK